MQLFGLVDLYSDCRVFGYLTVGNDDCNDVCNRKAWRLTNSRVEILFLEKLAETLSYVDTYVYTRVFFLYLYVSLRKLKFRVLVYLKCSKLALRKSSETKRHSS